MVQNEFTILSIALLVSAFFSGSEIAFVSTNRLRIEIKGNKDGVVASILSTFVKKPSHFITTMLIGNNIAMVIYGIFFAKAFNGIWIGSEMWGYENPLFMFLAQTFVATLVVLIVAEFLPKALCSLSPFKTLTVFSLPLAIFYYPLLLFVEITVWMSKGILKLFFKLDIDKDGDGFDRVDLFHMVDESTHNHHEEQADGEVNTEIFKNALEFANTKIRECMVPRPEVDALSIDSDITELKQVFFDTGRSKLVIFQENIDNIKGYVHSIDLFGEPSSIQSMIIPMPFASESTPASELLRELIDRQRSMAQVIDEFGGTAGIVTIEDLIEEIFGEIEDEYDVEALREDVLGKKEFVFSARHEIDYLNQKYSLGLPEGDYGTLGGYILSNYQSIPELNERIEIDRFRFIILEMDGAKIMDIKVEAIDADI